MADTQTVMLSKIMSSQAGAESSGATEEKCVEVTSKKRPRESPEGQIRNLKHTKLNTYWLSAPVHTANKFDILDNKEQQVSEVIIEERIPKPPIYVDRVSNIQPLTNLLNDIANEEYIIKILRDEEVKIQPKSTQAYTNIIKELQKKGTEFHTYKLKQERSFRMVLKNIHPSTSTEDLKVAIEDLGHQVTNIGNRQDI